jgi:hypothetical protein
MTQTWLLGFLEGKLGKWVWDLASRTLLTFFSYFFFKGSLMK